MWRLFQPGSDDDPARARPAAQVVEVTGAGRALLCSACGRRITTPEARIEIGGRHEHECVNPHGWRWRIGCFATAEGLVPEGAPERYWSWFPGFSWQVQNCASCGQLMGWAYREGEQGFYGLIVAHLREGRG
jgi:hypothetical protein